MRETEINRERERPKLRKIEGDREETQRETEGSRERQRHKETGVHVQPCTPGRQNPTSSPQLLRPGCSPLGPVVGDGPIQGDAVTELCIVSKLLELALGLLAIILQSGSHSSLAQATWPLHQPDGLCEAWRRQERTGQQMLDVAPSMRSPAQGVPEETQGWQGCGKVSHISEGSVAALYDTMMVRVGHCAFTTEPQHHRKVQ